MGDIEKSVVNLRALPSENVITLLLSVHSFVIPKT